MPRPYKGESENNFVNRCIVDPKAMADFPNVSQRTAFCYNQYERYKKPLKKNFVEDWQRSYERERDKTEKKNISKVRRFYNREYAKGIDQFINNNNNIQLLGLFKANDLSEIYNEVYVDTGLHFANWYARNFDKFATKGINPKQYQTEWQRKFAANAAAVAATNTPLVQGTARKTLIQVTTKLLRDPDFMRLGAREQARILRKQFDGYSRYQAERFVRTETTNISNQAVKDAALTVYDEDQLLKRWSVTLDGRERDAHRNMAGSDPIPFNEDFIVGGEPMDKPGDRTRASAKNTVNCRCTVVYIPKEDAETTGFTEIGYGLGGQEIPQGRVFEEIAAGLATTVIKPKPKGPVYEGPDQGKGEPLGDYLQRVDHPGYTTWVKLNEIEQQGYIVGNLDFVKLLKQEVKITLTESRSSHLANRIKINKKRYPKGAPQTKGVIAHEFGHAIHNQQRWVQYGMASDPIVVKNFKRLQKEAGVGLRGQRRMDIQNPLREKLNLYSKETQELRRKFPNLTDREFQENFGDIEDFFGALTKEAVGGGHGVSYYNLRRIQGQHAEFLAHISENYYNGNPVFKAMFPKVYEETIKIWQELIDSI
jgi:hypothetical protein